MTTSRPADPATVPATALREQLATGRGPRIIDVRTPAEFETAHIPGSYNVPLDLLREHRAELRDHLDDHVVLVCRSGARATRAGQTLADAGLPNVRVLDGGILAWQACAAPVRQGRPRWDLERQVRLVAGSLVLASVLASLVVSGAQWVAALIGGGLAVAALTNTCAMGTLLGRLPYNRRGGCDIDTIVRQLRETTPDGTRP
jgi:rhodanese-related sulfurtransferase